MTSIRQRLLIWLLLGLAIATAIGSWAVYTRARAQAREIFDFQLKQMATAFPIEGFGKKAVTSSDDTPSDVHVRIWDRNGVELYSSHKGEGAPRSGELGFSRLDGDEGTWRVYSALVRDNIVQVAQPTSVREKLATDMAVRAMLPLVALFPALIALVWITVGRGLKPLMDLAEAMQLRSASALEPFPEARVPDEVRPLVLALNALLLRLEHAMRLQRSFIADAAHELRTPLTAVALQLHLARRAQSKTERTAAFAKLKGGIERASHLVQQLLALARAEPEAARLPPRPTDLSEVARRVVVEQASMAVEKGLDLGLSSSDGAVVMGHPEALRVLLGNLVANAIQYTESGGRIDVETRHESGQILLIVSDSGRGIPPEERQRVFDRFYRQDRADSTRSGLGLAIVQKLVERYGASIELGDGPGAKGLRVTVRFPLASHGLEALPVPNVPDESIDLPQRASGETPAESVLPRSREGR